MRPAKHIIMEPTNQDIYQRHNATYTSHSHINLPDTLEDKIPKLIIMNLTKPKTITAHKLIQPVNLTTIHKQMQPANQEIYQRHNATYTNNSHINLPDTLGDKIPKLIIMMDNTRYFYRIDLPRLNNARHTIDVYQNAWEQQRRTILDKSKISSESWSDMLMTRHQNMTNSTSVWYLNNDDCLIVINRVEKRLAKYFLNETKGMYKADICRIAALYEKGGYYFDTDMEVIKPVILGPQVTFSSVLGHKFTQEAKTSFFQSFMAVAPKHPILKLNMNLLLEHYENIANNGTGLFGELIGPESLYRSYIEFNHTEESKYWPVDMSLQEVIPDAYRRIKRRGHQYLCNLLVHNATEKDVYFYSRIVGAGVRCKN